MASSSSSPMMALDVALEGYVSELSNVSKVVREKLGLVGQLDAQAIKIQEAIYALSKDHATIAAAQGSSGATLKRRCSSAASVSVSETGAAAHASSSSNGIKSNNNNNKRKRSNSNSKNGGAETEMATSQDRMQGLSEALRKISDIKVDLAIQTYEALEEKIRGLDADLRKCAAEFNRDVPVGSPKRFGVGRKRILSTSSSASAPSSPSHSRKKQNLRQRLAMTRRASGIPSPAARLDMAIDPSEPVYCFCKQVSFGEMIACDNPSCAIEWFHFQCVGLTPANRPTVAWFCSTCEKEKKRFSAI